MKNTNSIEIKLVPINDMPDILNITEQAKKLLKKKRLTTMATRLPK